MDKEQNKEIQNDEDVIEMVDELDEEVLDVIIRLYDKTMRILAIKEREDVEKRNTPTVDDDKLSLIMRMIAQNRDEMRSEFENINDKIDAVSKRVRYLEEDISTLEEQVVIIKKRMRK